MFIHEAAKEAMAKDTAVRRKTWKDCGWEGESFYLRQYKGDMPVKLLPVGRCWNPTPDDLMADDWEVVE